MSASYWHHELQTMRRRAEVAEARAEELAETLARAAYVAENLMGMIDRETWRASGGDDGQGHYEGEYRAEQLTTEIRDWAFVLAGVAPESDPA